MFSFSGTDENCFLWILFFSVAQKLSATHLLKLLSHCMIIMQKVVCLYSIYILKYYSKCTSYLKSSEIYAARRSTYGMWKYLLFVSFFCHVWSSRLMVRFLLQLLQHLSLEGINITQFFDTSKFLYQLNNVLTRICCFFFRQV